MATTTTRPGADVRPWGKPYLDREEVEGLDPDVCYAARLDSLFVYFYGKDRPSVGFVLGKNFTLMVDPETDEVLGFEIDHFLSEAVLAYPILEPLLDHPGMPARRVKRIRRQLDPEIRTKVAIGSLIEQFARNERGERGMKIALA